MAFTFPTSPSNGDTHTQGGILYRYNSTLDQWIGATYNAEGVIGSGLLTISNRDSDTDGIFLASDGAGGFTFEEVATGGGGGGGGLSFGNLVVGSGTLTLTEATPVMVILVGGGAGGEHVGTNGANTGGNGRKFIGYLDAPAGTYTLTQGGAGSGDGGFNAGSGGASSAFGFSAPGGSQNQSSGGAPTIPAGGISLYSATGSGPSGVGSNTPSGSLDATAQSIISSGGLGISIAVSNNGSVADLSALYTNIHRAGTGGRNQSNGNPVSGRGGYVAIFY